MAQVMDKLQPWLAALDERPRGGSRWLQDLRDGAASRFVELGFPTVRDEDWRFTNVAPIAAIEFRGAPAVKLAPAALDGFIYSQSALRVVIVNGRYSPELSRTSGLPAGVKFGSLATAITEQADIVGRYLGQLADSARRSFTALNTAFAIDGAFIYVPDGVVLEQPLHLLFVSAADSAAPVMSHPRDPDRGRRSQPAAGRRDLRQRCRRPAFHQRVTEVVAGESAVIDHYKVQQESVEAFHIAAMQIHAAPQRQRSRRTRSRSAAASPATTSTRCSTAKAPKRR